MAGLLGTCYDARHTIRRACATPPAIVTDIAPPGLLLITSGVVCLVFCNSYKWAQTHGRDPETHEEVPLFDPRTQHWHEHFYWSENGVYIIGLTAIGRATVDTL